MIYDSLVLSHFKTYWDILSDTTNLIIDDEATGVGNVADDDGVAVGAGGRQVPVVL